jgi:hypothetical protein
MKTYRRLEVQGHTFLTKVLTGGDWSASRHSHFTPIYPLHKKLGRRKAGRNGMIKRKVSAHAANGTQIPGHPVCLNNLKIILHPPILNTQPPIQLIREFLSLEIKRSERKAD